MAESHRICNGLLPLLTACTAAAMPARGAEQSSALPLATGPSAASGLPDWAPRPPPRIIEDRIRVEVGLLAAKLDTDLRMDESLAIRGTPIDAEGDLGLDASELLPLAEITLLPGKRHLVRLSGLSVQRSAVAHIDKEIIFEDQTYLPGERVDSELDLSMLGLDYGYRFVLREGAELTATLGVRILEVEANAVVRNPVVRDAESAVAPLPLLGLEGRYDFSSRWSIEGRVGYLGANVEDVDGTLLDARIALTWRMNPYLVLGAGYRRFELEVDSRDEGTPGFVNMSTAGPQLYVRASL